MKLIDEIYDNEKDIANFFSTVDWQSLGREVESALDAINGMPNDKAHKFAFDIFLVVAYYLNINVLEILKRDSKTNSP